jgi:hypothetical protein
MVSAIGGSCPATFYKVQAVKPVKAVDAGDRSGATSAVTQASADNRAVHSTAVTRSSPSVLAALTALTLGE